MCANVQGWVRPDVSLRLLNGGAATPISQQQNEAYPVAETAAYIPLISVSEEV
jgi:hypothetical protein